MAHRGDFKIIEIRRQIGDNVSPYIPSMPIEGVKLQREFTVGPNVQEGYIQMQVYGVQTGNARIKINGKNLPFFDIIPGVTEPFENKYWRSWWDKIPENFLKSGQPNILEIESATLPSGERDDIVIRDIVIHYREEV
jgi:hypothetical protein